MPRIRCHYEDCGFLEEGHCGAAAVEIDPETGCLTYALPDEVPEESEWEEEDLEEEFEEEDDELYGEEDDEELWDEEDEQY